MNAQKIFLGALSLSLLLFSTSEVFSAPSKKRHRKVRPRIDREESIPLRSIPSTELDSSRSSASTPGEGPKPASSDSSALNKLETTWKKGLQFRSKDERYSLQLRLNVQPRYQFQSQPGDDQHTFQVRRLKLSLQGNVFTKNLSYKVQANFVNGNALDILEDAYLSYRFFDPLQTQIGQFKPAFNRQSLNGDERLQFVDRSLASDEFRFGTNDKSTVCTFSTGEVLTGSIDCAGPFKSVTTKAIPRKFSRDLGFMLHGNAYQKKLNYQFSITNGAGTNRINDNKAFAYAGRVVVQPIGDYGYSESDVEHSPKPALAIGANLGYNEEAVTKTKVTLAGGDLGFKYKGFSLQGEYFLRNNNPTGANNSTKDHGYYAQAGYFLIPKHLEIAARSSQIFFAGANNNKSEFMGALSYYIFGHDLKLQTDYAYLKNQNPKGDQNNHRIRLQFQAWF